MFFWTTFPTKPGLQGKSRSQVSAAGWREVWVPGARGKLVRASRGRKAYSFTKFMNQASSIYTYQLFSLSPPRN